MKMIRANHVYTFNNDVVTFGIGEDGNIYIVTNADKPEAERQEFGMSVQTFSELVHSLLSLAFAAVRFWLTGSMYYNEDEPRTEVVHGANAWHGTGIGPNGVVIEADAISAYPREVIEGNEEK